MTPILTEAVLAAITRAVFNFLKDEAAQLSQDQAGEYIKEQAGKKACSWLGREPEQLAFQLALTRAYITFARHHPQWAASFFDEHFLKTVGTPFLARCLPWNTPPDPSEFATVWAQQVGLSGAVQKRRVAESTVAAADFVRFLRAKLRARDEFQQDFDSMALDALIESSAQTAQPSAQIAASVEALRNELEKALSHAAKYQVTVQEAKGLVIGDHATVTNVFQSFSNSNYATLQELYIAPDLVFERVRLDEFVGRSWLEADLDDFLETNDRGVWILEGEAGVGKTSFLAHLVRERQYLHFFAEQAPGDVNLPRALQHLAAQLISRFHLEPYTGRDTLPENLSAYPDFLSGLLLKADTGGEPQIEAVLRCELVQTHEG